MHPLLHILFSVLSSDRPLYIRGYRVDYRSPIFEPCPGCGGQTYRAVENRCIACCPRCKHLLDVYSDY